MTEQRVIVHIASTTPGRAMCGADMPKGGVAPGPVDTCSECRPLFMEYRRGGRAGLSSIDEVDRQPHE